MKNSKGKTRVSVSIRTHSTIFYWFAWFWRGQQFTRENYFFTISSMFFTPFIFIVEPKLDKLFYSTGIFSTFPAAVRSHLRANCKIQSWINGDIYEKNSVYVVYLLPSILIKWKLKRALHFEFRPYKGLFAAGALHKVNSAKCIDGQIGCTQKDLVTGVFCFTAMVMSEYEYFYALDKEKFEGYIHYWRVIGFHMGLMDEYVKFINSQRCRRRTSFENRLFSIFAASL